MAAAFRSWYKIQMIPRLGLLLRIGILFAAIATLLPSPLARAQNNQTSSTIPTAQSLNSRAIEATLDSILIDDSEHLRMYYVLKNRTNSDYSFERSPQVSFAMRLRSPKGTLRELSESDFKISSPLRVKAGQRELLMVTDLRRTYTFDDLRMHASAAEYRRYQKQLGVFVRSQWPDFNGFVILDRAAGLRIDLPPAP